MICLLEGWIRWETRSKCKQMYFIPETAQLIFGGQQIVFYLYFYVPCIYYPMVRLKKFWWQKWQINHNAFKPFTHFHIYQRTTSPTFHEEIFLRPRKITLNLFDFLREKDVQKCGSNWHLRHLRTTKKRRLKIPFNKFLFKNGLRALLLAFVLVFVEKEYAFKEYL